ncbi:DUF1540 domain-containing protein [Alicyclobacillus sp. SO9]|uniref:DUF1540 domain-containing protein n=1 Tax=Alicyclobacillus sp. SO9 TaxID=2665646 RepID=UPI0018E6E38B|nr:DUF1540 domain-containing protein [Alicyclobacillus sp. SO9]QQE76915.1 DUF1540 domain-containing protein [Alicyclobacillus sp. SO9]
MPKGVRCYVEECAYNDRESCSADSIEVMTNGSDIVGTSKGTLCQTFIYRNYVHRDDSEQPNIES